MLDIPIQSLARSTFVENNNQEPQKTTSTHDKRQGKRKKKQNSRISAHKKCTKWGWGIGTETKALYLSLNKLTDPSEAIGVFPKLAGEVDFPPRP
jgi:hypothetical protein